MISSFRALFLLVYALFWGGLTFYTGFVVRISHDVLNDPFDGGLITQRVTVVLQILGVIMVGFMVGNCIIVTRQVAEIWDNARDMRYFAELFTGWSLRRSRTVGFRHRFRRIRNLGS